MVSHYVSVVMPVYNGEAHVAEAIETVLGQTRPPDELVVVDDGSTDGTPQILHRYGSRIVRLRQSHRGATAAVNRGLGAATGMLIRRGAFDRIGPFDPALSATSFIAWLGRAKRMGLRGSMLDEVVLLRRLHLSNHGRVNLKEQDQEVLLSLHSLIRGRRAQSPS
jgi:glycosyltransferase involved in cell wall biosynthesis